MVCVFHVSVSVCAHRRSTKWSVQPWKQAISNERSCSLPVPCRTIKVIIVIWSLFRKMAANQKPLNQIGIFWYQFTPRKLLYLMISVNWSTLAVRICFGHSVYIFLISDSPPSWLKERRCHNSKPTFVRTTSMQKCNLHTDHTIVPKLLFFGCRTTFCSPWTNAKKLC